MALYASITPYAASFNGMMSTRRVFQCRLKISPESGIERNDIPDTVFLKILDSLRSHGIQIDLPEKSA
jgi:hypothetical protein